MMSRKLRVIYQVERNHQGRDDRLIENPHRVINVDPAVEHYERPGGVLNYYDRRAAWTVG